MRRAPPSWALLLAAAAMIAAAGTVFQTVDIDSGPGWLMLGAALTLLGQWSAIEIHHALLTRRKPGGSEGSDPQELGG